MKKSILSLIGLIVAAVFAPQASALPAFARQTGMECAACHQQHFPVLNAFGRSFKAGGYTMMGAQGLVEGEHLSIPNTLNAAILLKARYQRQNNRVAGIADGTGTNESNGMIQLGDEFSLFFGGRVAENIGFIVENNLVNAGTLLAGVRLPIMYDVAGAKLSAIPFTTDALSVQYGYELSSAGVMRANRAFEQRRDASAIQYAIADGNGSNAAWAGAASGLALVAQNDMGFVSYTRWTPNYGIGSNGGANASTGAGSNYVRVAATPSVGDWSVVTGVGFMSGSSELLADPANGWAPTPGVLNSGMINTKAVFADFQAQGQVGGQDLSVYVTYANAPVSAGTRGNLFNAGAFSKNAVAVAVDYSVIAHTLHVGGAYRTAKTGAADPTNALVSGKDNAVMVQAIYDLTQNVALHATTSRRSGSAYDGVTKKPGQSEYLLMLEAAW